MFNTKWTICSAKTCYITMSWWVLLYTRPAHLVLAHWNNSPWIDMPPHSGTLSLANQSFVWPTIYPTQDQHPNHYIADTFCFFVWWWPVLLVEETGGPRENHWPVASHWQTLSYNVLHLALIEIRTHNICGDRHWLHR